LDAEASGFVELVFTPVGSFDLNLAVVASDICTVRSGTNFRFVAPVDVLFVCSISGALSGDLDVVLLVVVGVFFFPVVDGAEDRRLKS
jgi:hypothetical protein